MTFPPQFFQSVFAHNKTNFNRELLFVKAPIKPANVKSRVNASVNAPLILPNSTEYRIIRNNFYPTAEFSAPNLHLSKTAIIARLQCKKSPERVLNLALVLQMEGRIRCSLQRFLDGIPCRHLQSDLHSG